MEQSAPTEWRVLVVDDDAELAELLAIELDARGFKTAFRTSAQAALAMVEDLPEKVRSYRSSHVVVSAEDPSELVSMEAVEIRYITRVMEAVNGNKTMAARVLGFDRKTLYRKLGRYKIDVPALDL